MATNPRSAAVRNAPDFGPLRVYNGQVWPNEPPPAESSVERVTTGETGGMEMYQRSRSNANRRQARSRARQQGNTTVYR